MRPPAHPSTPTNLSRRLAELTSLAFDSATPPPCGRPKTRQPTDDAAQDPARHCSRQVSRVMDASLVLMTLFLLVALLAIR